MKKIGIIVLAIFSSGGLFSQVCIGDEVSSRAERKVVLGIKGGLNRSTIFDQGNRNFVAHGRTGGVGGVYVAIPFSSFIGVQTEALISQKGFSGTGLREGKQYELNRASTYLDLPVQFQLKPFRFLYFTAGPQYSHLLSQRDEISGGSIHKALALELENDEVRKHLLGFVTGMDVKLCRVVVSGRVGWDMLSGQRDGSSPAPGYKNLWFQGTVGFRIY